MGIVGRDRSRSEEGGWFVRDNLEGVSESQEGPYLGR